MKDGEVKEGLIHSDITKVFQAISHLPYSADIASLKAWFIQSIFKYDLALDYYNEILHQNPFHSTTLRRKGELLKKLDREQEANLLLKLATLALPDDNLLTMTSRFEKSLNFIDCP